ncbi:MAG: hypothetical protein O2975_08820 [Proteobacteria bacterium]|nr:hypothetical protein [Pseudomonadota bacterium]
MLPERRALFLAKASAFGVHVAISAVVFAIIVAVAVLAWLPPPYFWIDGGVFIVAVAAVVDLILGPALTFLLYRPGRKQMALIFMVIAFVQSTALGWGVQVLYAGRPQVIVYAGYPREEFFPIGEMLLRDGPRTVDELRALSPERPPLVLAPLPKDRAQARATVIAASVVGTSVLRLSDRFLPLKGEALAEVLAAGQSREKLEAAWPGSGARVEAFATARGVPVAALAFVPVYGRYSSALLAIERSSGRLAGHVYLFAR